MRYLAAMAVGGALVWLIDATLRYPCHLAATPALAHVYASCRDGFAWMLW